MENQIQPNQTLPAIDNQQTIILEQPKKNNFLVILLSILLFISLVIAGFFAYQTQKLVNELAVIKNTTPTVTADIDPTLNWKTFLDPNLVGFSFKYDDKEWAIKVEDSTFCNDIKCGSSVGRDITITNKNYLDPYKSISLLIMFTNTIDKSVDNDKMCFLLKDTYLTGTWYRIRSGLQEIKFFPKDIIYEVQDGNCLLNKNLSSYPTLTTYMGKPTWVRVQLVNKIGLSMDNIADAIVRTIKFTN